MYLFVYLILSLQAFECVTKVKDCTAYVLVIEHVSHQEDVRGTEHFTANVSVAVQEVRVTGKSFFPDKQSGQWGCNR